MTIASKPLKLRNSFVRKKIIQSKISKLTTKTVSFQMKKSFNKLIKLVKGFIVQKSSRKSSEGESTKVDTSEKLKQVKDLSHEEVAEFISRKIVNKISDECDFEIDEQNLGENFNNDFDTNKFDNNQIINEIMNHKRVKESIIEWEKKYHIFIKTIFLFFLLFYINLIDFKP